jgi:hypothetical protein
MLAHACKMACLKKVCVCVFEQLMGVGGEEYLWMTSVSKMCVCVCVCVCECEVSRCVKICVSKVLV